MNAQEINRFISKIVGVERDYFHCLNACAEFEKGLTNEQHYSYWMHLRDAVYGKRVTGVCAIYEAIDTCFATAEQRCRAFVAVMEERK